MNLNIFYCTMSCRFVLKLLTTAKTNKTYKNRKEAETTVGQ